MNPVTQSKNTTTLPFLIALIFSCFALAPKASAQCPQMCDGVTFNTALGIDALVNNTTGGDNTAIGFKALENNTTGFSNTATGAAALEHTTGSSNTATGAGALQG